jgi:hypothetical protein
MCVCLCACVCVCVCVRACEDPLQPKTNTQQEGMLRKRLLPDCACACGLGKWGVKVETIYYSCRQHILCLQNKGEQHVTAA